MQIFQSYQNLNHLHPGLAPAVVGIGNFDGVHCGHQVLIDKVVQYASMTHLRPSILTFSPHPLRLFKGDQGPRQLYSIRDREHLLQQMGIDFILTQHFDRVFASLSPHDFVKTVLVDAMKAQHVIVGYDFAFGSKRSGRHQDLIKIAAQYGVSVDVIEAQTSSDSPTERPFSSTWIRELITKGELASATKALGRLYHIRATVSQGLKRGRELGFPTANLKLSSEMCPGPGVYAAWMDWGQNPQRAVVSIGSNPTFSKVHRPSLNQQWSVEAHILQPDFEGHINIYDQEVILWFSHHLRPMIRFSEIDDLITQIQKDCETARHLITQSSQPSWPSFGMG